MGIAVPTRGNQRRVVPATVGADGVATADLSPTSSASWMIRQVSIELETAPLGATASLRANGVLVTPMIPAGDVAVEPPPLFVSPGDDVVVRWTGCTPGDVGTVLVIYDEVATT